MLYSAKPDTINRKAQRGLIGIFFCRKEIV